MWASELNGLNANADGRKGEDGIRETGGVLRLRVDGSEERGEGKECRYG